MFELDYTALITAFGAILIATNIIVEVIKIVTKYTIPTNLVALAVSEFLTVASGVAYFQINGINIHWYTVTALIVIGFVVALSSMIGFDKVAESAKGWWNHG